MLVSKSVSRTGGTRWLQRHANTQRSLEKFWSNTEAINSQRNIWQYWTYFHLCSLVGRGTEKTYWHLGSGGQACWSYRVQDSVHLYKEQPAPKCKVVESEKSIALTCKRKTVSKTKLQKVTLKIEVWFPFYWFQKPWYRYLGIREISV